ncbi:SHOCT domain-containing protein [Arthrobacter sp. TB 23]|uniref:SHOCT domain-containing protein n=1 Tax=Arthrobacter sp. TB 23 TaxID=494419 RepID=UPI0002F418F0
MGGDGMVGMGWGWIFWSLLIIGVLVLVFVLVRSLTGPAGAERGSTQGGDYTRPTGAGPGGAREILEERYARGEISTEEYRERLRTLEEGDR